jgi:hypothetical protein
MSEASEPVADEEEPDKQRLDDALDSMSITELFELLINVQAKIHQASNLPDSKQGPELVPER